MVSSATRITKELPAESHVPDESRQLHDAEKYTFDGSSEGTFAEFRVIDEIQDRLESWDDRSEVSRQLTYFATDRQRGVVEKPGQYRVLSVLTMAVKPANQIPEVIVGKLVTKVNKFHFGRPGR